MVTFPTVTAHILGQLLMFKGSKHIDFGSDSLWYGSPQWQIEAMWRFQIPDQIRERWGYPELDEQAKRNILGLNSAKLYGLQVGTVGADQEGQNEGENEDGGYGRIPADFGRRAYPHRPLDLQQVRPLRASIGDRASSRRRLRARTCIPITAATADEDFPGSNRSLAQSSIQVAIRSCSRWNSVAVT